jgi:hypothetical protein
LGVGPLAFVYDVATLVLRVSALEILLRAVADKVVVLVENVLVKVIHIINVSIRHIVIGVPYFLFFV